MVLVVIVKSTLTRNDILVEVRPIGMMNDSWRQDSPFGLRRYGKQFVTVGQDALEAHRRRSFGTASTQVRLVVAPDAIYYNLLHGVELGLKAYLRQIDAVSLSDLRRPPYGHNLSSLIEKSINCNLLANCPKLKKLHIDALHSANQLYMNKEFEYIRIGFVQYPPIEVVAEAADTLITSLENIRMRPAPTAIEKMS